MKQLYDNELEKTVLGAVMFDWQIWHEISDIFFLELFYNQNHINVAKCILTLKNEGKQADVISVNFEMKKRDYYNADFNLFNLQKLTDDMNAVANTPSNVRMLQELWIKRQVKEEAAKTIRDIDAFNSDIFDIIDNYEKSLTKITDRVITSKCSTPQELFNNMILLNEKILKMKGNLSGITSGFRIIDDITGGWQPSDLIILGADAGMGKTSLALEFLKRPALLNIPVAFFSLEMSERQVFARMVSSESDVELNKILRTGLNEWDVKTVTERTALLRNAPISYYDKPMTMFDIRNHARKLKRKNNIRLLIIDYLQLIIPSDTRSNRSEQVSYISRSLKGLAKELNIPIIAISSLLNKEIAKRPGKIPQKSDLRESGNIEFDADIIALLYRPEYYKIFTDDAGASTANKCMFMIEKHRNGAIGEPVLGFEGRLTKFYSIGIDEPNNQPTPLHPNNDFIKNPF